MDALIIKSTQCWAVLWLMVALNGCGSGEAKPDYPKVTLQGVVALDGEVVQKGTLQFVPETGVKGQSAQGLIVDGKFTAQDVPVGKLRVTFTINKETGKMITEYSTPYPEIINLVPAHYRSGIEFTTTADDDNVRFDLSSKSSDSK
jgi:hypothetical protein